MNNIPTKEEIQELLCKAFTISNLNQSEMAKKTNLTQTDVCQILHGTSNQRPNTLICQKAKLEKFLKEFENEEASKKEKPETEEFYTTGKFYKIIIEEVVRIRETNEKILKMLM